jgi:hypothetical protein
MSLLRLKSWLAAGILLLTLTSVASAQKWQPFGPVDFEQYHDRQPFAPPDVSDYDLGPPERNGFFVTFERLYWAITPPDTALVGSFDAETATEQNTVDTGWLKANYTWANRIEGGWRDGKHGWLATGLWTNSQWQETVGTAKVLFDDPNNLLVFTNNLVIPPVESPFIPNFSILVQQNVTRMMGVELLHTYRFDPGRWGGEWELFCGARYLQFNDRFTVTSVANIFDVFGLGTPLAGSFWNTETQNNMVGPELGLRMANRRERWTFVAEGRFTAAANFIDTQQNGAFVNTSSLFGGLLDFIPTQFQNSLHTEAFTPIVELRLETSYELTKAIAFKVGYTALWLDNIARASNRIHYQVPDMGILRNKYEDVLINGVTFGIEINR